MQRPSAGLTGPRRSGPRGLLSSANWLRLQGLAAGIGGWAMRPSGPARPSARAFAMLWPSWTACTPNSPRTCATHCRWARCAAIGRASQRPGTLSASAARFSAGADRLPDAKPGRLLCQTGGPIRQLAGDLLDPTPSTGIGCWVSCTSTAYKPQRHEPASGSHEQAPRMRHDNTSRKTGALRTVAPEPAGAGPVGPGGSAGAPRGQSLRCGS